MMIKFFRHIRQNLLMENKTGRYLKYAIGEIVLVVIGILIALQINNWNEQRKQNQIELTILKEIKNDLLFSSKEIDTIIKYNQSYLNDYKHIKTFIDEGEPYDLSLDLAFSSLDIWEDPYLPNMGYESLKTKGIDLIKNDSLKRHIVKIYDFGINGQIKNVKDWEWSFNQNTTQKYMVKHIRRDINEDLARPIDFEKLKKDEEFRNFLNILILVRISNIKVSREVNESIKNLIEHIETEINSRS